MSRNIVLRLAAAAGASLSLTGCLGLNFGLGLGGGGDDADGLAPGRKQLSVEALTLLAQKGMRQNSPIFIRIFKEESEFEIWKAKDDGRFYHFRTYPICAWSGTLGPKVQEGDKQAPEGFYTVSASQMNPNSRYHLAFNLGFPNSYDRANGRSGGALMVHGNCKSAGCFAMTDALIEEIFILARESLEGGQREFHVQALPFRLTEANLARHRDDRWYPFWRTLKEGYDYFEFAHVPPKVAVCHKQYMVNVNFLGSDARPDPSGPCPAYAKITPEPQPLRGAAPVLIAKVPTQPGASAVQTASVAASPPSGSPAPGSPAIRTASGPARPAAPAPALAAARPQTAPAPQTKPQPVLASAAVAPAAPQPPRQRLEPLYPGTVGSTDGGHTSSMAAQVQPAPVPVQPQKVQQTQTVAQMADQPGDVEGEQRVLKAGKSDRLVPPPAAAPSDDSASAAAPAPMFGYAPSSR